MVLYFCVYYGVLDILAVTHPFFHTLDHHPMILYFICFNLMSFERNLSQMFSVVGEDH